MSRRQDLARGAFDARRWRDFARLLPILGVFLLVSPLVSVFDVEGRFLGIPLIFVFVYGTWSVLILLAVRVAGRIDPDPGPDADEADGAGGGD